jgi:hypothetical protein
MKKNILVLIIIAIAMIGIVSAEDNASVMNPIGGAVGYYDISSTPSGAAASVDGTSVGTTPTTATLYVTGSPGHTVTVNKAGYELWSQYYAGNPAEGQHIAVNAVLVPIPTPTPTPPSPGSEKGYYSVTSSPSGGSVTFDGTNYGLTPVTISVSATGTPGHTITVSMPGYQTWSQYYSGNPAAGQTINVIANLNPITVPGTITVSSNPSGASAVLDSGYDQLTTPGTFYSVSPGWHTVQVSKSGYQPYSTSVQVTSGGTSNVYATLTPTQQTGSISISSNPVGASIYVDTIYQGETNQIVGSLAVGPHAVLLKKSGYKDYSQTVQVNSAQITYMTVTLTQLVNPTTGDLDVSSTPPGASVYLNGAYQGETPVSVPLYITALAPGSYSVVLKKSGYQDYSTTARIVAGATAQVSAVLQPSGTTPTTASAEIYSQPSGADVYINNAYKGITPLSFDNVPIDVTKTYTIEIRMAGYKPYTNSGSISPGQNIVINAALTPLGQPTPTTGTSLTWLIIDGIAVIGALLIMTPAMALKRKK